ncbi:MAG: DNA-directed RNA polymerase subunit H [Methanosarcinales archaeon]|nr:DNA-directed RNA polymerase subunit H [Methanosarcinales archaeon]
MDYSIYQCFTFRIIVHESFLEADYLKKSQSTINILEHVDVPTHTIISVDESETLLNQYGITSEDLPKIKMSDATIKEIGGNVGDIIEIERHSPTAATSKYYRVVVE